MYAAERQQRILTEARRAGRVEVALLADSLGVAAETVRRDLTALERRGSLRRVHGDSVFGAVWRTAILMGALVGAIVLYRQVVTIAVLWLT